MAENTDRWRRYTMELQSIAQAGLYYANDPFDVERYTRVREIALSMLCDGCDLPAAKVRDLFCSEVGYQTPKVEIRTAMIQNDRILLVRERNGRWSLPGGWMEPGLSVRENAVKETREETGLDVQVDRLIAVQDRQRHNRPLYAFHIYKVFVLCTVLGGAFQANVETSQSAFFSLDELPALSEDRINHEQIAMCFAAQQDEQWQVVID